MPCGETYKKKTSRTLTKEHKEALKKALKGRKLTQEHKDKISKSRKECAKKKAKG